MIQLLRVMYRPLIQFLLVAHLPLARMLHDWVLMVNLFFYWMRTATQFLLVRLEKGPCSQMEKYQ